MDFKKVVGEEVIQITTGKIGVINKVENDYVYITLEGRDITTNISVAFLKRNYYTFVNEQLQLELQTAIQDLKDKEEQERLAKKQAQEALKNTMVNNGIKRYPINTIYKMLGANYPIKYLDLTKCYTHNEVEEKHKFNRQFGAGIYSTKEEIILFSSMKKEKDEFKYHDSWDDKGRYIFSGTGEKGDQDFKGKNKSLLNAASEGKKVFLYIVFSSVEYYLQGEFKVVDHGFEMNKDKEGTLRKECKFILEKVTN